MAASIRGGHLQLKAQFSLAEPMAILQVPSQVRDASEGYPERKLAHKKTLGDLAKATLRRTLNATQNAYLMLVLLLHPDTSRLLVHLDTSRLLEHPDTSRLRVHPDTSRLLVYPDTSRLLVYPDTSRLRVHPDTIRLLVHPDTIRLLVHPDTSRLLVPVFLAAGPVCSSVAGSQP